MKKKDYTVLVIIILALAAIITYTFYLNGKKKKHNFMWTKTYEDSKVQPYDFGVLKALLENKSGPGFIPVTEKLSEKIKAQKFIDSSSYIFIGRYCYLTSEEIDALLDFAHVGHQVVLIAEGLPDTLLQTLSYYTKPISLDRFDENIVNTETGREKSKVKNHRFNFRSFDQDTTTSIDWYFLDESQQLSYYYGETGNR